MSHASRVMSLGDVTAWSHHDQMAGAVENNSTITRLAAPTSGVCTRAELLEAGLSERAIKGRLARGRFTVPGRGVYLVTDLADERTPLFRAQALFPTGPISHQTAGSILSLAVAPVDYNHQVDITVAANVKRSVEGIVLHRRRAGPAPADIVEVQGLRVTSKTRTIVDLAAVVGRARLKHVVKTAISDNLVAAEELMACVDSVARQGVTGITNMRRALSPLLRDEGPIPQSVLEGRVAELLVSHGLDGFERQYRPPWFDGRKGIVDFAHPALAIVLEADGLEWHRRDANIINDRQRDRVAAAHGWVTIRVTWAEVTQRPAAVAEEIRNVVVARSRGRQAAQLPLLTSAVPGGTKRALPAPQNPWDDARAGR